MANYLRIVWFFCLRNRNLLLHRFSLYIEASTRRKKKVKRNLTEEYAHSKSLFIDEEKECNKSWQHSRYIQCKEAKKENIKKKRALWSGIELNARNVLVILDRFAWCAFIFNAIECDRIELFCLLGWLYARWLAMLVDLVDKTFPRIRNRFERPI